MKVAIDGPAGAGKSTIAKAIARELGFLYIDTGAMYRAIAWAAIDSGIDLSDASALGNLAERADIELHGPVDGLRVRINGRDVTSEIRMPEVSEAASRVSAVPAVRRALVARQQVFGRLGDVVMEGRDIGTVVFPDAEVKVFLDASSEARASRRFAEDTEKGRAASFEETLAAIVNRDERDRSRDDSPLAAAADAVYLDSTSHNIEQMTDIVLGIIKERRDVHGNN